MVRKRSGFRKKALNFAVVAVRDPWSGTQNFVVVPLYKYSGRKKSWTWGPSGGTLIPVTNGKGGWADLILTWGPSGGKPRGRPSQWVQDGRSQVGGGGCFHPPCRLDYHTGWAWYLQVSNESLLTFVSRITSWSGGSDGWQLRLCVITPLQLSQVSQKHKLVCLFVQLGMKHPPCPKIPPHKMIEFALLLWTRIPRSPQLFPCCSDQTTSWRSLSPVL